MKRWVTTLLSVLAVILFALPAAALAESKDRELLAGPKVDAPDSGASPRHFDGARKRHDRGGRLIRLMRQLKLSDEQALQARQIMSEHRSTWQKWRSQHGDELEKIDRQIRALQQQRRELLADAPQRGEVLSKLRPLLNSDQKERLDALGKNRSDRGPRPARRGDRRGDQPPRRSRLAPESENSKLDL